MSEQGQKMGMMLIDQKKLRQAVAHLAILDGAGKIGELRSERAAELRGQRHDLEGLTAGDQLKALRLAKLIEEFLEAPPDEAQPLAVAYYANDTRQDATIRVLRTMAAPLAARTLQEVST